MKSLLDSALSALRSYIEKKHDGNVASAARELDISVPTLHTWMKGTRIPSFSKMAPLLEKIGAYIVSPDERQGTARDVCFVEARTVPAGEHLESPDTLRYPWSRKWARAPGLSRRASSSHGFWSGGTSGPSSTSVISSPCVSASTPHP